VHTRYDTRIFHKHSLSAIKHGYDVTILVNDELEKEIKHNVNILSTGRIFESKFLRLLYSIFVFPFHSLKIEGDLFFIHDPELVLNGFFLYFLRKRVIFDVHEDYQMLYFDNKTLLIRMLGFLYKKVSSLLIRLIYGVFVVNENLYRQYHLIAKDIHLVPNFPYLLDDSLISMPRNDNVLRIVFAGGIKKDWNIALIINVISKLNDVEFHLVGKSTDYLEAIDLTNKNNIIYHGYLSKEEVDILLSQMDIGIALSSSPQAIGEGTIGNTKVFEYLAHGLPVIVNENDVWNEVISGNKVGFVLDYINESRLFKLIDQIMNSRHNLVEMSLCAKELVKNKYNWENTFDSILTIYERIAYEV
jgi:glycosyltransferase involved in cell wall biosynthesis